MQHPGAEKFVPQSRSLRVLAAAARDCRGCDLWADATQVVFGRGSRSAAIMLVGEQPGDHEDLDGEVFVGPAGRLLRHAADEAGLDWNALYVTNAVKHFRFQQRGKRRIHQKPTVGQSHACRPWLGAELAAVRPRVLVALGAVAAAALYGSSFSVTEHRGERMSWPPEAGPFAGSPLTVEACLATFHPSAALRPPTSAGRHEIRQALVDDLRFAASLSS